MILTPFVIAILISMSLFSITDLEASAAYKQSDVETRSAELRTVTMDTLTFKGKTYYLIYTEEQLRAIAEGQFEWDKNYMMQVDISLSSDEWLPIGTKDKPFTGSFNGNGFEISGLTMTDPQAELVGLFGYAEDAHLYNITLKDVDIKDAGSAVTGSKDAVCALSKNSRIYDNFVFYKK